MVTAMSAFPFFFSLAAVFAVLGLIASRKDGSGAIVYHTLPRRARVNRWPGGVMTGYILWINERWSAFCKLFGRNRFFLTDQDHREFDKWLEAS